MPKRDKRSVIAANLCFVEQRALTGPGHYAVQVFENLAALAKQRENAFDLIGFVQQGCEHHFCRSVAQNLITIPNLRGRMHRVLFEQLRLPFLCRDKHVDLLWSPAFVSPLWGAPHLCVTIHDMYYRVMPDILEPLQRAYWRALIPISARNCSGVITNSDNSKADILRYIPIPPHRVYTTPLASRLHAPDFVVQSRPIPDRYILLVANTTPNKNCDNVLRALALLLEHFADLKLLHIGNDIDNNLRRSASFHGLDNALISLGHVSENELVGAYQHSAAVIVASLYEGFGMPAAEAQAMGAPLICSDRSALPEAAGGIDGGAALFVDPEDPFAIAYAVQNVVDNDALRSELVRRGLMQARTLSWASTARHTFEAFKDMMPGAFH